MTGMWPMVIVSARAEPVPSINRNNAVAIRIAFPLAGPEGIVARRPSEPV